MHAHFGRRRIAERLRLRAPAVLKVKPGERLSSLLRDAAHQRERIYFGHFPRGARRMRFCLGIFSTWFKIRRCRSRFAAIRPFLAACIPR